MNKKYKDLKQKYDAIGKEISDLYEKQNEIRVLMEKACIHENVIEVFQDSQDYFLLDIDVDDEETKFKCLDCYRYFTENQLK